MLSHIVFFFFFFAFVSVASRSTKPNILLPAPIWENPSFFFANSEYCHPGSLTSMVYFLSGTLTVHNATTQTGAVGFWISGNSPMILASSPDPGISRTFSLSPQKGCWHPLRCSSPSRGGFLVKLQLMAKKKKKTPKKRIPSWWSFSAAPNNYVIFCPLTLPHDEFQRRKSSGGMSTYRRAEIDIGAWESLLHCCCPVCCHETNECWIKNRVHCVSYLP